MNCQPRKQQLSKGGLAAGSMLIDVNSRLGMGPLTGGGEGTNCAGGEDFFASLYVVSVWPWATVLPSPPALLQLTPRQLVQLLQTRCGALPRACHRMPCPWQQSI